MLMSDDRLVHVDVRWQISSCDDRCQISSCDDRLVHVDDRLVHVDDRCQISSRWW